MFKLEYLSFLYYLLEPRGAAASSQGQRKADFPALAVMKSKYIVILNMPQGAFGKYGFSQTRKFGNHCPIPITSFIANFNRSVNESASCLGVLNSIPLLAISSITTQATFPTYYDGSKF